MKNLFFYGIMRMVVPMQKGKIVICPYEEKMNLLRKEAKNKTLLDVKYMTKEEFLENDFFSYTNDTLFYLMDTYGYPVDICREYLRNMIDIDIKKDYQNPKINFLKDLKIELLQKGYLEENPSFQSIIQKKDLMVSHYYDLDAFEEDILHQEPFHFEGQYVHDVYEFSMVEEEVNFVCLQIIGLLEKGISCNQIFLTNVSSEYYYPLKKYFSYYKIPLSLDQKESIYGTKVVQDYLNGKPFQNGEDEISKKLNQVVSTYQSLDSSKEAYRELLVDGLKHTYISSSKYNPSVSIKDFYSESFGEEDYVFLLGFHQDVIPKKRQDTNYLSDEDCKELNRYSISYWNERYEQITLFCLNQINHLTISYALNSSFQSFYPSTLIEDYQFPVLHDSEKSYTHSHLYNKIQLGNMLDQYDLNGEKDESIDLLQSVYQIPYRKYQNQFQGISHDEYLTHLPYPLQLSYTSLNAYNECGFQYYIKYVLKLEEYEDTFPAFIGSLYHYILSLYQTEGFDFEREYQKFLEERELSFKEKILLVRIKEELLLFLEILKKQDELCSYRDSCFEKRLEVDLSTDVSVKFVGYVDKILYRKEMDDTYFSIIDYKTGKIDTNMEPLKYGLHMQLPIYLYLLHVSRLFTNPIFTGVYYQNILFPYPTWSSHMEKDFQERYLLNGYSTDQVDVLKEFDPSYHDSLLIKSLKYSEEKGFGPHSKVLSNDTLYQLVKYTEKKIYESRDHILQADFSINPKNYHTKNISCEFCPFQDLCYHKEKDLTYLNKVDHFDFLGGEQ